MAKRPLEIDMCSSSQLRDTQGEMLNVEGADITELELGKGRLNDNHGKGFFNCLGKVTAAKKIFKAEDCDDDRQRYYWEKVKSPYIYVKGVLFDDEDHPNAKAAAAILRNIHKTDCPLKIKASVEGGVVSRGLSDPALLARTKIHSIALTFVPANQATLVEPLNLDKSEVDADADFILIKSVLHLAETNVPSFRHIIRDASAEKIENNINEILAALGKDEAINLKQELIKDSLQNKIVENVVLINEMVHAEVERMDKSTFKGALAGAALMAANPAVATPPSAPSATIYKVPENHQKTWSNVAQENPVLGAIGQVESSGAKNYNHEKDKNGWSAGGMFGMRPTAAAYVLRVHPELSQKYPELAEAAKDLNKNHSTLTERFNTDPVVAADFAKALLDTNKNQTRGLKMLIHSWNHGLKGTWDRFKNEGEDAINNDEYVQKVMKAMDKLPKKPMTVSKALTAGYGGAGSPTSMTGGAVLQSEAQEIGPKTLTFITCDHCGKDQVYGKYQVKCREPECGKAFSMAKLEKFFSLQKSKQNTPEEQAKIDDFMQRKAKGQSPHATQNTGTKGHLPPSMEGTFHGQGATTSGKITNKGVAFTNKKTGERGFANHPQQEQHQWAWDHKTKKWNHIRTSYGSPNRG